MTYASKGIFQIEFDFEMSDGQAGDRIVKGFAFDFGDRLDAAIADSLLYLSPPSSIVPFSTTLFVIGENESYDDIMAHCEGEYGGHDLYGDIHPDFISLEMSVYECERNRMGFLLQDWRNWFLKQCEFVGELNDINPEQPIEEKWAALVVSNK